MPPEQRLFVHIGTHKTGTTSFQHSLGRNRRALAAQGVWPLSFRKKTRLPFITRAQFNAGRLAHSFLRPKVASVARLKYGGLRTAPKIARETQSAFLEMIASRDEPDLILSSEAFCMLRTPAEADALRAFLAETGRIPVIVVTFRNDTDWRASWTNQIEKNPEAHARNQALPDAQRADGEWYFDRAAIRAFWSEIGDLHEVDYDRALGDDGNVIPALYRAMGVDPAGLRVEAHRNTRQKLGG